MSPKHLDRYMGEFEGRHNQRPMDTVDRMASKGLTYAALTAGGPAYPRGR